METIRAAILISSDKGSRGEREDLSGPAIRDLLHGYATVTEILVLPDEKDQLAAAMCRFADEDHVDLILTSGGTGFAPRDVTPEATMMVVERPTPGITEAMRAYSAQFTNRAALSRATAGIRGRTWIVNLPGSPRAIKENLLPILPALEHGMEMLRGPARDCADDKR